MFAYECYETLRVTLMLSKFKVKSNKELMYSEDKVVQIQLIRGNSFLGTSYDCRTRYSYIDKYS